MPGDEDTIENFLATICTAEWHLQHDRGRPMAETVPELCARHPRHAELIRAWRDRYLDMISGPVEGMEALLDELHATNVPAYGLTNSPAEFVGPARDAYPIIARLRGMIVSGEEGIIKPDREIFELLLRRFGLDASSTLFVDDLEPNVDAARQHGLQASVFVSAPKLRADLAQHGVIDGP